MPGVGVDDVPAEHVGCDLEVQEDVADEAAEDEVRRVEVGAHHRDRDDDDDRRRDQLLASRPLDLLELGPGLAGERAEAAAAVALRAGLALRLSDRLDLAAPLARALGARRRLVRCACACAKAWP